MTTKTFFTKSTALWVLTHILALATATVFIGPQNIEYMFSKDPVKVTIGVCGAIIALGATFGAGVSPKLQQAFHTDNIKEIEVDISKEPAQVQGTINKS